MCSPSCLLNFWVLFSVNDRGGGGVLLFVEQRSYLQPIVRNEVGSENVTGRIKPKDWSLLFGGCTWLNVQILF